MRTKLLVLLGVCLLVTLINGQGPRGGQGGPRRGEEGERKPRPPPKTESGKRPQKPSQAHEGEKGRMEFNLTEVNREVIVWPKGCVFGIRKMNCTTRGERCKPLIFALDTVKEMDTCGGREVGKAPGGNKRQRGASRDDIKKLECIVQSSDACTLPDSSVNAVCINASAYLSEESYFTFSLYIATENGTFTYLDQQYNIARGQTKFTMGYVGKTCCADDDSCMCDDGVAGALDVGLRIVGPPGKARRGRGKGQGRGKVNEIDAGDAKMDFPTIVEVDNTTMQMQDDDIRVNQDGKDSKINMCFRNVSNYFLYDPTISASSSGESSDSTIVINEEFGEGVSDNSANNQVFTVTSCILAATMALLMH